MDVFLSHTSEMRNHPQPRSFVQAAERAAARAGATVVDMEYFPAIDLPAATVCRERMRRCDAYVGLIGFRYGSPVPDQPDLSYTELEFNTAAELGIPRLVFLLDENAEVPFASFVDREFGSRQESFRHRLMGRGTVAKFRNADELETAVLHALVDLKAVPEAERSGGGPRPGVSVPGPRPWMVPLRSGRFVDRPEPMAQLIRLLTTTHTGPVALTTALQGTGGFGKTTLAEEVCRRPEVEASFPDGILWVTVGEHITEVALASKINDLILRLSGEHPTFSDPNVAGSHLGDLLGTQRRLLVVDDVWSASQLQPFLLGGPGCVRLVTTRNRSVLPNAAVTLAVDAMNSAEANEVLRGGLGDIPDSALAELLRLTGRWPVLLSLVNGAARGYVAGGATAMEALEQVTLFLRRGGPTTFDVANYDERRQAVAATVQASVALLAADKLERYRELAVFPEDVDIPCSVLEKYFLANGQLDQVQVESFCRQLADLALVSYFRLSPSRIRLHDVIRRYLRSIVGDSLPAMNRALLDAVRGSLPEPVDPAGRTPWWSLPESDEYLWRNLGFHLCEAQLQPELDSLVRDLRYLTEKTRLFGPVATEADLALATDAGTAVFRRVIGQAAHLLTLGQPSPVIAATLLNRLDSIDSVASEVADFVRRTRYPYLRNRWAQPDTPDPSLRRVLSGHDGAVFSAVPDPEGRWLASGGDDGTLAIWDAQTGMLRHLIEPQQGTIWACVASPDGSWLATAGNDGSVRIWDASTGAARQKFTASEQPVFACAVGPDGRWLATSGSDGLIRIWDVRTGELTSRLDSRQGTVWTCAASPDGSWLATAGDDGSVRIWDVDTGRLRHELEAHTAPVWACAISRDGTSITTAGGDGLVVIWEADTAHARHSLTGHSGPVYACTISPDGSWIATAGGDQRLLIWDASTGRLRRSIEGHTQPVWACAASPDGTWIATGSADSTVRIWSVRVEEHQRFPVRHSLPSWACAAAPDGAWLAASGADGPVRVWDVATDRIRYHLAGHDGPVWACATPADGNWLATAGADSAVRTWAMADGELTHLLCGHQGPVWACAAAADGSWLATAGDDGMARIWDAASGQPRHLLHGHAGPVWTCAAAPGGWLATIGADQTVRVWNIDATGGSSVTVLPVSDPIRDCCWVRPGAELCVSGDAGMYLFSLVLPDGVARSLDLADMAPHGTVTGRAVGSQLRALPAPSGQPLGQTAPLAAGPPRHRADAQSVPAAPIRLPCNGEVGYFMCVATGDVMDVAGWKLDENGTPVIPWHRKTADVYNQQWSIAETPDGFWRLSPLSAPSKALDVFHAPARYRLTDTTVQWDIHPRTSQQWKFEPADGGFRIVNRDTGNCATYLQRAKGLQVVPLAADSRQLWQFVPAAG